MRVLVVEDDTMTCKSIEMMLQSNGMNPYSTDLGEEAIELAQIYDYDAITLDLNLPDISGFEVLKAIKHTHKINVPVIILSGMDDVTSKIKAFGFDADDYLTKPFHREELIARIHAITSRYQKSTDTIKVGNFAVDILDQQCTYKEQLVHLTNKEFKCLELMAMRQDNALTKEMFLNHIYHDIDVPESKIIDIFICKLRRKLLSAMTDHPESIANQLQPIETVWGRGYKIRSDYDD